MSNFEIRTVDLPTFVSQIHRHAVGFDQMFETLNRTFTNSKSDNYPPHNVVQVDDSHFVIELAIAGFEENEVSIELNKNLLTVKGEKITVPQGEYLHKGISTRDFTRVFPLGEHIEVNGAKVRNGILTISLQEVIPDEAKPKSIAITYES
jgi:molecular chaperone IbpA